MKRELWRSSGRHHAPGGQARNAQRAVPVPAQSAGADPGQCNPGRVIRIDGPGERPPRSACGHPVDDDIAVAVHDGPCRLPRDGLREPPVYGPGSRSSWRSWPCPAEHDVRAWMGELRGALRPLVCSVACTHLSGIQVFSCRPLPDKSLRLNYDRRPSSLACARPFFLAFPCRSDCRNRRRTHSLCG